MHASILQSRWVDDLEFHEYSRHEESHSDRIPSVLRQNQAFPMLFMLAHVVASSSTVKQMTTSLPNSINIHR